MDRPPSTTKQLYLPLHAKGVVLVTPLRIDIGRNYNGHYHGNSMRSASL